MDFPRLWLELIIALSIFVSIIFLLNENYSLNEILASLEFMLQMDLDLFHQLTDL